MDNYKSNNVYVGHEMVKDAKYPAIDFNFSPSEDYPEYLFKSIATAPNHIYELIRDGLHALHYDDIKYGSKHWNPLGHLISPGDTVLIKPNMVKHQNGIRENGIDCLITHPSLVRVIIDYVLIALNGKGKILIADAPVQECNFQELLKIRGYDKLQRFYEKQGINIPIIDLRNYSSVVKAGINIQQEKSIINKSSVVDLKDNSMFSHIPTDRYNKLRITNYNPTIMSEHHSHDTNEYSIAADILNADVIINMPKPKTHRFAGLTMSLKNMVGINTNKEWLPHHTNGSKLRGGDAYYYPNIYKRVNNLLIDMKNRCIGAKRYIMAAIFEYMAFPSVIFGKYLAKDNYQSGNWYGNDTIWRTILDLNRIVRYANKDGIVCSTQQRKIFNVADMIISGEGEGPLAPSPKSVGIIAMSEDAVCMDEVLATIMGVDYHHLPSINNARTPHRLSIGCPDPAHIISNNPNWNNKGCDELDVDDCLSFVLTSGWDSAPSIKRK